MATTPTEHTTKPTTAPTNPTTKPTTTTSATWKPIESTTVQVSKPTEPSEPTEPTEPTTIPTEPTTKPTDPTTKPTESTTMPATCVPQPAPEENECPDTPKSCTDPALIDFLATAGVVKDKNIPCLSTFYKYICPASCEPCITTAPTYAEWLEIKENIGQLNGFV